MTDRVEKEIEGFVNVLDHAAAPDKMTQAQALEFYESIADHCTICAQALRHEMPT